MKLKNFLFVFMVLFVFSTLVFAEENPYRYSTPVKDVVQSYDGDWIVSPDEEPLNDHSVSNAPECDIYAVLSCYDSDQLRIDILLANNYSYEWDVWYAVSFEYTNMIEYYTYYPSTKEFYYEVEKNGEITESYQLGDSDLDFATVTSSGDLSDGTIAMVIDKEEHIAGEKGKKYYLTAQFYSGFIDGNGEMQIADYTTPVDLEFVK